MKKHRRNDSTRKKLSKKAALGISTWFVLTVLLVNIDNRFQLSDTTEWFSFAGIFVPVVGAIFVSCLKPLFLLKHLPDRKICGWDDAEERGENVENINNFLPECDHPTINISENNSKQLINFEIRPSETPSYLTDKEYAQTLIDCAKDYAEDINKAVDVIDFVGSFKSFKETVEKLAWLNEKKKIYMYPPPRTEYQKACDNIENAINDFITRAVAQIKKSCVEWVDDVDFLIYEIEHDDWFNCFMSDGNKVKVLELKEQIKAIFEKRRIELERIQEEEKKKRDLELKIKQEEKKKLELAEKEGRISRIGLQENLYLSDCNPMKVIVAMESNLKSLYDSFIFDAKSAEDGRKILLSFKELCLSSNLPLMAEVRLESLVAEYEQKFSIPNPMYAVDQMNGHEFERWCAELLKKNGFTDVKVTKSSGDQGVDVLAVKEGIRYAIQCKCYSSKLGNGPVQEVNAGKALYHCQVGVVMTNQHFTAGAQELADVNGVLLWDREKLEAMLESSM